MMPELGKYATEVLSAYAVSIVLIGGIVWQSVRRDRKVREELSRIEKGRRNG
ncbi:MAG: heme exporter protein CcmD [Alphaproteobacteria bacterium]|nr:MAG: heme exporter protein CcmD [Alphaproteobacteria bacterium]